MAQATPAATPHANASAYRDAGSHGFPNAPHRRLPPHRRPKPLIRTRTTAPAATASPTTPRLFRHKPQAPSGDSGYDGGSNYGGNSNYGGDSGYDD